MRPTFLKGVVLGAVVGSITVVSTVALAGTGVGGVFNLGKTNTVDATTVLSGATHGAQLQVTNTGTRAHAVGVGIKVTPGTPPLAVNSATKVNKLNADELDGVDSTEFLRRMQGGCRIGFGIAAIGTDGHVSCTHSAIQPVRFNLAANVYTVIDIFPTDLDISLTCGASSSSLTFWDNGATGATLNWMFSQGGTSSTVNASGVSMNAHTNLAFVPTSRLEGQWIYDDGQYIVTVNLHFFGSGTGCEVSGTADITALS